MIESRLPLAALLLAAAVLSGGCASSGSSVSPEQAVFYPPPPGDPRLQYLGRYSGSADVEEQSAFRDFVVGQEQDKTIQKAHGVAWRGTSLYVCDSGFSTVTVLDTATHAMRPFLPDQPGFFKKPIEIAIAPDGWKYVTDTGHRKVLAFDADDRYQAGYGDPEKWKPTGIAATTDRLYVTDAANHALVILDRRSGAELQRIGRQGAEPGEFYYPLSVCVGADGDIYVSDCFNCRIQRFTPDGAFVKSVGSMGMAPGQFARPRGVAVDREGRIYVADAAFENVQIFDAEGRLLLFFGGPGDGPGAMNLPASVKIDYDAAAAYRDRVARGYKLEYVVFVTSQAGANKVGIFGFLRKE